AAAAAPGPAANHFAWPAPDPPPSTYLTPPQPPAPTPAALTTTAEHSSKTPAGALTILAVMSGMASGSTTVDLFTRDLSTSNRGPPSVPTKRRMADGGALLAACHLPHGDRRRGPVPHLASSPKPPGCRKPAPDHDQRAQLRAGSPGRVRGPAFPGVGRQGAARGAGRDQYDTSLEGVAMTSIESVTLEVPDPAAGEAFY